MNYRGMRCWDSGLNRVLSFALISCILLIYIFINIIKTDTKSSNMQKNMLYIQILNYSMPVVKVTSFDSDDMAESTISIKDNLLKFAGITLNTPLSIISREISCFSPKDLVENKTDNSKIEGLIPYNLKEDTITKTEIENDLNLPNQIVDLNDSSLKKELPTKPEVLIYHTHTTESFYPSKPNNLDSTKNVCAVGEVIKEELEKKYGVSVIHDLTIHNATAYSKSYSRSAVTVEKYLKQYKEFKLIIDLHRDAVEDRNIITTKINNENVAKIMFVTTKKNPRYRKNIQVVKSLNNIANELSKDYSRGILERNYGTNFYNQDKSDNSILIEVGSHKSTLEEAENSGKYLARIIAEYINSPNN